MNKIKFKNLKLDSIATELQKDLMELIELLRKQNENDTYILYMNGENPKVIMSFNEYIKNTFAINKLCKLENIFELMERMQTHDIITLLDNGRHVTESFYDSTILYNPKTNNIEIYNYEFSAMFKIEEYGKSWWIKE